MEKDIEKRIQLIKSYQRVSEDDIKKLSEAINTEEHAVFKRTPRIPVITYKDEKGNIATKDGSPREKTKIGIPLAEEIVNKAISFASGNLPKITYTTTEEKIKKIKEILNNNKEESLNASMCEALFSFKEVAEIWYVDPDDGKIRVHLVSPLFGDRLYPEIDRKRKMQSFAYSNEYVENGETIEELVHYSREKTAIYKKGKSGWILDKEIENIYGKITVAYSHQKKADFEDVLSSIYRLETTTSNLGDSVDDTAYPDKVFTGKIIGISSRPGESNQYEIDGENGDVKYVESEQGTDLIRLDLETNESIARKQTQTPDISLDSLKGLGSGLSGEVLRRLLTDAILKVKRKSPVLAEHYHRRVNILNVMISKGKGLGGDFQASVKIIPYVPEDEDAELDRIRKMIDIMPTRYIIKQFKERIDSSIDEDEILEWIKEEKKFEYGGSLMEE